MIGIKCIQEHAVNAIVIVRFIIHQKIVKRRKEADQNIEISDVLFEFHPKFWNNASIGIPVRSLL